MRSRQFWRRPVALLLSVSVLACVAALGVSHVAVARPVVVATSGQIAETAVTNFDFDTREYDQVPLNTTVTVTFTNADPALTHTFTILNRSGWVIPNSASTGNVSDLLTHYGSLVSISAAAGQTVQGTFTVHAMGWYEFLCAVSGHFEKGMYGFIAFGENLPSNLSLSGGAVGPGIAVFIIVATIVALTVLAIVLGFVIGRREGSVHEMPPERLGYPEPSGGAGSPSEPPHAPPPAP